MKILKYLIGFLSLYSPVLNWLINHGLSELNDGSCSFSDYRYHPELESSSQAPTLMRRYSKRSSILNMNCSSLCSVRNIFHSRHQFAHSFNFTIKVRYGEKELKEISDHAIICVTIVFQSIIIVSYFTFLSSGIPNIP